MQQTAINTTFVHDVQCTCTLQTVHCTLYDERIGFRSDFGVGISEKYSETK